MRITREKNVYTRKPLVPMNLQFFAEPKSGECDGTGGETGTGENGEGAGAGTGGDELTLDGVFEKFSVDDILGDSRVSKKIQSITDATVTKALKTAKEKWTQEQLEERDEAKKLEKMSAEQRARYELEKERTKFAQERAKFEREQLVVATGKELLNRGLDSSFAEYLTADTAEETTAKIDKFEQLFNTAVSNATNKKMKGTVPKDKKPTAGLTLEKIKSMSQKEINENWDEVQKVLSQK